MLWLIFMRFIILNDNSIYSINMIIDRVPDLILKKVLRSGTQSELIDRVPNLILKKILRSGARSELHLVPDIT